MRGPAGAALAPLLVLAGCSAPFSVAPPCVPEGEAFPLPRVVRESSGIEPVGSSADAYWTHNDSGGEAALSVFDGGGAELSRISVRGARNDDWEDLAAGPCGEGPERCLYIADTGDNALNRSDPAVYRLPEPVPGRDEEARAERFPVRFPRGPRDVEALYLLPGERLFFVTKGRAGPIQVLRHPGPLVPGEPALLEPVQHLTGRPPLLPSMVTGAASTADGRLVALRTYETLTFYRPDEEGRLAEVAGGRVNLRPLQETQGEGVAFAPGNRVVLTSEGGLLGGRGSAVVLGCSLGEDRW